MGYSERELTAELDPVDGAFRSAFVLSPAAEKLDAEHQRCIGSPDQVQAEVSAFLARVIGLGLEVVDLDRRIEDRRAQRRAPAVSEANLVSEER